MLLAKLGIDPRPLGHAVPQPWPLHHHANCWTATLFSFYLIGFFHSESNVKELAAKPGIDPRPLGFEHHSTTAPQQHHSTTTAPPLHHRDFSVLPNPLLSLLSQLTLRLFKRLGAKARNRFLLLRLWAPQPYHYTTMAKGERLWFFYST